MPQDNLSIRINSLKRWNSDDVHLIYSRKDWIEAINISKKLQNMRIKDIRKIYKECINLNESGFLGNYTQSINRSNVRVLIMPLSNLLILNRVIFNLPEDINEDISFLIGNFMNYKSAYTNNRANICWPMSFKRGFFEFKSSFIGIINSYSPDNEFDYFVSRFRFRNIENIAK